MINSLKRMLLVDDSPRDTELAVTALETHNLANEVIALRDGSEVLDYCTAGARLRIGRPASPL